MEARWGYGSVRCVTRIGFFFSAGFAYEGAEVLCWELVRRTCLFDICWSGWLCIWQDGQLMLEEGQGLCMWSSVSFCG